ncbi:MAG: hypothetical protein IJZ32_03575 [Clostridia bacterium]|nr:hypothetical protein [Clostridia bacterium]
MKKKFISAMAISMCLCMGAMAGCGGGNNSSSSSSPKEPLTKDEILAEIGDAYAATKAYKDGYTVTGTSKDEYKGFEDEEAVVSNGTLELTANPNQKLFYYKEAGEGGYELEKLLKNGNDYVRYNEYKEGESEVTKNYSKYTEVYATYYINEYYSYENIIDNYISAELFDIESIDTYNAAYAKVFADSIAEVAAGTADEESEYYGWTASGSGSVSVEETEDGAYVLTTKMTMEMSSSVENMTQSSVQETVVTAKDGKLTGWKETEETTVTKKISDTETQTSIEKEEMVYTVTYAFDQAKYDSVVVTLPETVEPRNYYSKDVTVLVNGMELDTYTGMNGSTIQGAITYLKDSVVDNAINATADNATLTLYKDAAYTQELTATGMNEADFYAIETVYAKVELKEGYALMNMLGGSALGADVTAEQKLIFGAMLDYTNQFMLSIVPVANPYDLASKANQTGAAKVMVNGVAYTENALTMESGETYEVKFVREMTKAHLNIFMMMY